MAGAPCLKTALVTNIPPPYRVPIFNRLGERMGEDFLAIFCAASEANRKWDPGLLSFNHVFLRENAFPLGPSFVHNNLDVLRHLHAFDPEAVITTGFNPTHLYAWGYASLFRKHHIPMTDGWLWTEKDLSALHRLARRRVFASSASFIGASKKSVELFRAYGAPADRIFISQLCADNDRFRPLANNPDRPYDVLFSGQIIPRKLPGFFVAIVKELISRLGAVRVLVMGSGPLQSVFTDDLAATGADVHFAGHVPQCELPAYYSQAKILLFTTENDPWGVVANEALASGTPVITSPFAGVSDDLVFDGVNGYICGLKVEEWAEKATQILQDRALLQRLRDGAIQSTAPFNYDAATQGILDAIACAGRA